MNHAVCNRGRESQNAGAAHESQSEGTRFMGSKSYLLPMNSTLILGDLILPNQSQFIELRNHVHPDPKCSGVENHWVRRRSRRGAGTATSACAPSPSATGLHVRVQISFADVPQISYLAPTLSAPNSRFTNPESDQNCFGYYLLLNYMINSHH